MSVMTKPHWKKILFFVLRPDCCLVFVDVLYISADCPAAESVHESVEWSSAVCSYNTIKASEVNDDFSLLDSHTGECVANSPQRDTGKENIPVCVLFRCLYFSLSVFVFSALMFFFSLSRLCPHTALVWFPTVCSCIYSQLCVCYRRRRRNFSVSLLFFDFILVYNVQKVNSAVAASLFSSLCCFFFDSCMNFN